jgi:hypothetical protein
MTRAARAVAADRVQAATAATVAVIVATVVVTAAAVVVTATRGADKQSIQTKIRLRPDLFYLALNLG